MKAIFFTEFRLGDIGDKKKFTLSAALRVAYKVVVALGHFLGKNIYTLSMLVEGEQIRQRKAD